MSNSLPIAPCPGEHDALTALRSLSGRPLAKRHTCERSGAPKTIGYSREKHFTQRQVRVEGIDSLHEALEAIGKSGDEMIIRGAPNPDLEISAATRLRRAKNADTQQGEEAPWFIEVPRRWVLLDFDGLPNPEKLDPLSPAGMIYLTSLLPPEFQEVSFSYSLSSSAGLGGGDALRGHLWFWLDRSLGERELTAWLGASPVDAALFRTVQPHYIAPPIFEKGRVDPISQRKGLVRRARDMVAVPDITITTQSDGVSSIHSDGLGALRGYAQKMARLGDGEGGEGLHDVVTSAIAAYVCENGPDIDRTALIADIRERVAKAAWNSDKHSAAYLHKQTSDRELNRSIEGAINKFVCREPAYPVSEKLSVDVARRAIADEVGIFLREAVSWEESIRSMQDCLAGRCKVAVSASGELTTVETTELQPSFLRSDRQSVIGFKPPPRHILKAQVGLGKTAALIEALPQFVDTLDPGHCVVIAAPNHRLTKELKQRIAAVGLQAEVYLGPAQPDPAHPSSPMCRRLDDYAVFQAVGAATKLCQACAFSSQCGYQKQKRKSSPIWIVAHSVLYHARRKPIPPVDILIIDENPLNAGFEGDTEDGRLRFGLENLNGKVARQFGGLPAGELLARDHVNLSASWLANLACEERRALEPIALPDEARDDDIAAQREIALQNLEHLRLADFYDHLCHHGGAGLRLVESKDGAPAIVWMRQRCFHSSFEAPTLVMDATAEPDAVRFLVDTDQSPIGYVGETFIDEDGSIAIDYAYPADPVFTASKPILAETPHVTIRQVLFSAAQSKLGDGKSGATNAAKLRRYIEARSGPFHRTLVICQKALEGRLIDLGLPASVETAHFNDMRGRDAWKDVDLLIIIGRTQPPPSAVEAHAAALFRSDVRSLGGDYYEPIWKPLSGSERYGKVERHPDPQVELLRRSACEAEVIQAIGRGRAVNRDAKSPLQIDLINTVPLPDVAIDEVLTWEQAQPSPWAVIAGRFGLLLPRKKVNGMANVVAALLPDLFSSPNAARQAELFSQADLSIEDYSIASAARDGSDAPLSVKLKPTAARYSVPAQMIADMPRRPLGDMEAPPGEADVTEDGIAAIGDVYILS